MGKIISLVNPKGGTAKSTLALCLGSVFGDSLIVDLDPQGSVRSWFQDRRLNGKTKPAKPETAYFGFAGLPAKAVEEYARRFDYVVIDCPGESEPGTRTRTALVCSDLVVVPVRESEFDVASLLDHLLPLLEEAEQSNARGGRAVFLPVMCHVNSNPERTLARFRELRSEVLPAVLKSRGVFRKFSERGRTLEEYAERGARANDRIQANAALAEIREIAAQIEHILS